MAPLRIFQADAFTSVAFTGNPAAICLLDNSGDASRPWPISDDDMRNIAAEMNLSETAFVTPAEHGDWASSSRFLLRWFTPQVEVSLCGHATLATAALLFFKLGNVSSKLVFSTMSGDLDAERDGERGVALTMPTFEVGPIDAAGLSSSELSAILNAALGDAAASAPGNRVMYAASRKRILVHLDDDVLGRKGLEALAPDHVAMKKVHDGSRVSSVTVTTRGGAAPYDFISRHFSPWIGIPEDPVTGSAHSYISTYWRDVLKKKEFFARQASKRGGDLQITLLENDAMRIVGETVFVLSGELNIN